MISSMGSSSYGMGQMSGTGSRPSPKEMFSKIDADDSGGLDKTEFSDMAEKMSQMTGEDVDTDELFAEYDEDGDGELSEEETQAFMDDNRPEGPPPGGMGGMQGPPPPPPDDSQLFSDSDEDEDGSLDETEAEGIAQMISEATGEDMTAADLIDAYDADGDGELSEEETLAALEENRPDDPPPAMAGDKGLASSAWSQTGGIENYLMTASLGSAQNQSSDLASVLGGVSSGSLFSVNTMA